MYLVVECMFESFRPCVLIYVCECDLRIHIHAIHKSHSNCQTLNDRDIQLCYTIVVCATKK